jgi:hypothetical protein
MLPHGSSRLLAEIQTMTTRDRRLRMLALVGVAAVATILVFRMPPLPQDEAYHRFADDWVLLGAAAPVHRSEVKIPPPSLQEPAHDDPSGQNQSPLAQLPGQRLISGEAGSALSTTAHLPKRRLISADGGSSLQKLPHLLGS